MHQFFKVPMMNGAEWQNVLMMANTPNLRPQRKYQKWQWRDMARNVTWWKGERLVAGQVASANHYRGPWRNEGSKKNFVSKLDFLIVILYFNTMCSVLHVSIIGSPVFREAKPYLHHQEKWSWHMARYWHVHCTRWAHTVKQFQRDENVNISGR